MRCPFCKQDSDRVVDSRASEDGLATRRRRECLHCKRRYTTYERIEKSPLKVMKKDGRRVPYDREKLKTGIELACRNLAISADDIEGLVTKIENDIFGEFEREVPSRVLGERVMDTLRKLHQVAYVRFASVYREFKDVTSFLGILEEFQQAKRPETKRGERRGPDRKR